MSSEGNIKPNSLELPLLNNINVPTTAPQKLTNSSSATGNPRNKCALKPGHSLMDWIRLGNSGADLAGTSGRVIPVNIEELVKHNTRNDAWIAIRGKAYNVTRYMDFHPGGVDELMRGVGRDATKLFDEVHAWVNYPQLLSKCYIGPLKYTVTTTAENDIRKSLLAKSASDFDNRTLSTSVNFENIIPRFDWIQKRNELTVYIYTRQFANPGFILKRKSAQALLLLVQISHLWHEFEFELQHDVVWPPKNIQIGSETGKIEIVLTKLTAEPWSTYGASKVTKLSDYILNDERFDFEVVSHVNFNHDSFELRLRSANDDTIFIMPLGFHITIEASVKGEVTQRSYTPVHTKFLSNLNTTNSYDLNFLIKTYENGLLSAHLAQLTPGAILQLSVPRGNFKLHALFAHRNILFLAAGSGLTPFLNLFEPLLKRNVNRLECLQLLYFNKTSQDIWTRDILSKMTTTDKRFSCDFILSQADESWLGAKGRLTKDLLSPLLNRNQVDAFSFIAICGPDAFNTLAVELLKEFDFKTDRIYVFQG